MNFIRKYYNIILRIMSGYALIIGMVFTTTIFGVIILDGNKKNTTADMPFLFSLRDFKFLISESEKLTNSWIYLPAKPGKEALIKLQTESYPALKADISEVVSKFDNAKEQENSNKLVTAYDELIAIQQEIMKHLASEEDYMNDDKVDKAISLYETQLIPGIQSLQEQLSGFSEEKLKSFQADLSNQEEDSNLFSFILKLVAGITLFISWMIYFLTRRIITKPLNQLKEIVLALGRGEIASIGELKNRDSFLNGYKTDEIGQMVTAIDVLTEGVKEKTSFADEIGKENYDMDFHLQSDSDIMGKALIGMRNNLKKVAEEDAKRNWATEGMAKFGEILRHNNDDMNVLTNNILSNLIKYIKANQGGIFIINDNNKDDAYLELIACYAFERKKYITKKIIMGEGLTGQVWQEGEYVYLTDIPNNYIHITSGLGGANPKSVLIMPLKMNEAIFGILEVASFNNLEKHEIEFVQKLSESIASTISTAKINERTKKLLDESQQQSEALRSQEEETKQNMEEMNATHEEMQRKEKDFLDQINALKNQVNELSKQN
ncbi:MAG: GAF domain-containing protein [Bacteroidetes bacterium]|nr:GAF domain-containing protein [Bacteroidota bacterium]